MLTLSEWLERTSPNAAKTEKQRAEMEALRARVLAKAGTTISTLRVAKCRGRIGPGLLQRMAEATADEKLKISPPTC